MEQKTMDFHWHVVIKTLYVDHRFSGLNLGDKWCSFHGWQSKHLFASLHVQSPTETDRMNCATGAAIRKHWKFYIVCFLRTFMVHFPQCNFCTRYYKHLLTVGIQSIKSDTLKRNHSPLEIASGQHNFCIRYYKHHLAWRIQSIKSDTLERNDSTLQAASGQRKTVLASYNCEIMLHHCHVSRQQKQRRLKGILQFSFQLSKGTLLVIG